MPELDHIILADGVAQRPDGKIDLFGAGFDTIFTPSVPARHGQLAVVMRILLTAHEAEAEHVFELHLMHEDGLEIAGGRGEVGPVPPEILEQFDAGDRIGVGAALTFVGLVFPEYGRYGLSVLWDGNELRQALRLRVAPPPAPPE